MSECKFWNIGYERFEKVVDMLGGKWKLRILYKGRIFVESKRKKS